MRATYHSSLDELAGPKGIFHLTWLGPDDGACAPLLQRVRTVCAARGQRLRVHIEPLDSAVLHSALRSFDSPVVAWADRVIVACETRLDYPWRVVELLQCLDSAVPWGVVTGSWHDGSRRTGLGPVTHWQLPWYRWWEGWYGWFFPELARVAARCATQFESITAPIDLATPGSQDGRSVDVPTPSELAGELVPSSARQILIVAACRETFQGWQLSATTAGWNSVAEHSNAAGNAAALDCILWDDSCQDRLPGGDRGLRQACRQIEELKRRYPGVSIIAALSLAHLSSWTELQRAGASDFIVKPSFGLPLADYLVAHAPDTKRA